MAPASVFALPNEYPMRRLVSNVSRFCSCAVAVKAVANPNRMAQNLMFIFPSF